MRSKNTMSAPWLLRVSWEELITLTVCLGIDVIEYMLPMLMAPALGDVLDFAGVVFCVAYFGWLGAFSLLELIPGLDVIPIFTLTWLMWYTLKRRKERVRLDAQLERWK